MMTTDREPVPPPSPDMLRPILGALGGRTGLRLLDLGPGRSGMTATLIDKGTVRHADLVDYNASALAYQQRLLSGRAPDTTVRFLEADLGGGVLPPAVAGQRYDLILCTEVLEHVAQPLLLLCALAGTLENDGLAVLSVPNGWTDRFMMWLNPRYMRPGGSRGHQRSLSPCALTRLLEDARLRPVRVRTIHATYFLGHIVLTLLRVPIDDDTGQVLGRPLAAWLAAAAMRALELSGAARLLSGLVGRNILALARKSDPTSR